MRRLPVLLAVIALAACGEGAPTVVAETVPVTTTATTGPTITTTTRAAEAQPATTSIPLPPIRVVVAGDTSFTHGLHERDPLGEVAALLSDADLTIVNLETTVAEPGVGTPIDKRFVFKSPPESATILAEAGVDVVALANNHALDYGPDAVLRTIEIMREGGLATAGTGGDPAAAYAGTVLDVGGWQVAVLSFTRVPCDRPEPGETFLAEIAWACPDHVETTERAVRQAAATADLVIVMAHWGVELEACPADHQRELANRWVRAGADLIVGSHPHVLQGIERIGEAWVVYSTGNLAFPSAREASSLSAVFRFDVAETGWTATAVPVRIVDGRPLTVEAPRREVLDLIEARSFALRFGDDGDATAADVVGAC